MDPAQLTPETLRQLLSHSSVRQSIVDFNTKIRELGDNEKYLQLCQTTINFQPTVIAHLINNIFSDFIHSTPPGHDPNHIYRDYLGICATVSHDPYIATAAFTNDVVVGLLGGIFHDIGVSIWPRYRESDWQCGHAEIGAWLFYLKTAQDLPENIRLLTSYAISAHTHYLNPLVVKFPSGYLRQPYSDTIFDFNGQPVRLGVWLTRFADRIDCNGVTLLARYLTSTCDALESGGNNLTGDQFYTINHEALHTMLLPLVRPGKPTPPTALEHVLRFANSNFGHTPYSLNDHLFPHFNHLIQLKVNQVHQLLLQLKKAPTSAPNLDNIHNLLLVVSGSPHFERAWYNFQEAWDHLEPHYQASWDRLFTYTRQAYSTWLDELKTYIDTTKHPLITPLQAHLTAIITQLKTNL